MSKLQRKPVAATNGDVILSMYRYKVEYNIVTTFWYYISVISSRVNNVSTPSPPSPPPLLYIYYIYKFVILINWKIAPPLWSTEKSVNLFSFNRILFFFLFFLIINIKDKVKLSWEGAQPRDNEETTFLPFAAKSRFFFKPQCCTVHDCLKWNRAIIHHVKVIS